MVLSLETIAEENVIEPESTVLTAEEIASAIAEGTRHELVILGDNVQDAKVIIDNLAEGTEVLTLDRNSDVLDQINEYLDKSDVKYDAIHVVSHGGDGYLLINNTLIDMESLKADPASWAAIGEHMTEEGDMLLYGCNVANTENGKAFANQLAALTGADVAASVDSVGGKYGWELEYTTSAISAPALTVNGYDVRLANYNLVGENDFGYDFSDRQDNNTDGDAETYYFIQDGKLWHRVVATAATESQPATYTETEVFGNYVTLSWLNTNAENGDTITVANGVSEFSFTQGIVVTNSSEIDSETERKNLLENAGAGYDTFIYTGTNSLNLGTVKASEKLNIIAPAADITLTIGWLPKRWPSGGMPAGSC